MNAALALPIAVLAPLSSFVAVAVLSARERRARSERAIAWATRAGSLAAIAAASVAVAAVAASPRHELVYGAGDWLALPDRPSMLVLDELSLPLFVLTVLLGGLVGRFSVTYLHREPGFSRFFLLFNLFAGGMSLLSLAGSLDLFFAGWELVGISSVLLIAFFHERAAPVERGIRALAVYRACDVGLLLAVLLGGHGVASGAHGAFATPNVHAALAGGLLLLSAMGKSAQMPFGGWLPRAMEGPTPSSAIFYGALSVHAGVYLLARTSSWMLEVAWLRVLVIAVGAVTAVLASIVARVQSDAKNGLAFATMTQVGVMFVEIGLGFPRLAMVHMVGHACLRTWQMLRAPGILAEMHGVRRALGGPLPRAGGHWERLLPARLRARLHATALHAFFVDDLLEAAIVRPLTALARVATALESAWISVLTGGLSRGRRGDAMSSGTEAGK